MKGEEVGQRKYKWESRERRALFLFFQRVKKGQTSWGRVKGFQKRLEWGGGQGDNSPLNASK